MGSPRRITAPINLIIKQMLWSLTLCRKYQYERKLKEWGFKKYRVGAKKWEFIDHRLDKMEAKREITRGKDFSGKRKWESQVYIDGILYPPKRVKYEISRKVFRSTIDKITSGRLLVLSEEALSQVCLTLRSTFSFNTGGCCCLLS